MLRSVKYISPEHLHFNFTYFHMETESRLIFCNILILGNLNHQPNAETKEFCTLNSYEK